MTSWLPLSPYVRAQKPQPGCVHVVPLESAGFADRDHLYVVGLDAASTGTRLPEDPLLSDEQRETLSDETTVLPRRSRQVDVDEWRTRQALARHTGTLTLTASTYDLDEDEDLFEAPLYLRLKEASQNARGGVEDAEDPTVEHVPLAPTRTAVLSDLDRWTSRCHPAPDTLEDALGTEYAWLRDGLDAEEARASDTYTEYDGLLSPRDYPGLNPLGQTRPVTAGRLERYARSPFGYFLRSVLDVTPLDEPALDDVAWLDAMQRGAVLHDTFRRFMGDLQRRPTPDDRPTLRHHFDAVIEEQRTRHPPPTEVVYATTRRTLWTDALLFLRVEAARTDDAEPYAFELGFGYPAHRREPSDHDTAPTLQFGDLSFALRGRVDRVDQGPDGALALWDYKTGSSRDYDEGDLLGEGKHLQWALYAYALEALEDTDVSTAGYFFTSTDELGKRVSADPASVRTAVGRRLQQIADGTAAGAFPVTDADDLRYDFARLFHDYNQRQKQLRRKSWPDNRPAPPPLRDE
jgi:ATP-dependent helicase/DNAse subunit B